LTGLAEAAVGKHVKHARQDSNLQPAD
jgi:hypothetical protein